jgi:hypothetical protein
MKFGRTIELVSKENWTKRGSFNRKTKGNIWLFKQDFCT